MAKEKTARNKRVVRLLQGGMSFAQVAKKMGFTSKGTVWSIWKRHISRT